MIYMIDGCGIDLDSVQADVTGVEWEWTGTVDTDGVPLMQALDGPRTLVPLLDVYRWHGPLIPVSHRLPSALWLRVITAPTPAVVLGGAA